MTRLCRLQTLSQWLLPIFLLIFVVQVFGFVPAREDDSDPQHNQRSLESLSAMRERLGVAFNYTPDLLHPEICRYLTEEECRDANDSLQAHARKMKRLPQLAAAKRKQQSSSHHQDEDNHRELMNPNIGVVKVLVVLLQFTDHADRTLVKPEVFEEMWNSNGKNPDLIPSGSVSRWFQLNSYGLYEIEAVIVPWTMSDNTEEYYSFGNSGLVTEFEQAFWPALDKLDQNGIDWSQYDIDQDGVLDAVVVLHSGYAAELKGTDCSNDRDFATRIWSHAFASSFSPWVSRDGAYQLGGYVVGSAFRDTCGSDPARIGTMTHEFMHTMGLVDLYDGQEARVGRGVGGFDIMATPYGPKDDPSWPGHLSAWSRMMVGWLMPIEIVADGEYSIQASELSNQAYVIRKPYPLQEYLLIENRQPLWFDARLWTGGLVIYHIDDRAPLQTKRGYPGQEGWPRNGNHYQVAVLGSDGQYNLEKGDNFGDVGDFWKEGMTLGPGNGRVFPNTDAYQFGSIRVTGVTIDNIKKLDTVMTFRVSGLSADDVSPDSTTTAPSGSTQADDEETPADDEETPPPVTGDDSADGGSQNDSADAVDDSSQNNSSIADIGADVDMEVSKAEVNSSAAGGTHRSHLVVPVFCCLVAMLIWQ